MSSSNQAQAIIVETKLGDQDHEEVRCQLSRDDLGPLKARDPFLYHSIPAVHKAVLAFKEIDLPEDADGPSSAVVTRKSRVATEGHISLLVEDLVEGGELFTADHEDPELDVFPFLSMPHSRGDEDGCRKDLAQ